MSCKLVYYVVFSMLCLITYLIILVIAIIIVYSCCSLLHCGCTDVALQYNSCITVAYRLYCSTIVAYSLQCIVHSVVRAYNIRTFVCLGILSVCKYCMLMVYAMWMSLLAIRVQSCKFIYVCVCLLCIFVCSLLFFISLKVVWCALYTCRYLQDNDCCI